MKKITNFMLPEHINKLYTEEAISSVSIAREVADKINELVGAYNALSEIDLTWKQEQEGTIRKAIIYIKDNLINTLHDLTLILENDGFFDGTVAKYVSELEARINNLISNIKEGSTTLDAELLDIRYGINQKVYGSAGESVREQIKWVDDKNVDNEDFHYITEDKIINVAKEYSYTNGTYLPNGNYQDLTVESASWARPYLATPFIETEKTHSVKWYGNLNSNSRICFYNENKKLIKKVDAVDEQTTHSPNYYLFTDEDRNECKYFTVSFHSTAPEIYKHKRVIADENIEYATREKVVDIGGNVSALNGIYMVDGRFQDLTVESASWARTYFATPLLKTNNIVSITWYGNLSANSRICFYDKNKKFIRKVDAVDEQITHSFNEYVFTDNDRSAYYFSLSYHLTTPIIRKTVNVVNNGEDFTTSMINLADLVKRVRHNDFSMKELDGGYMTLIFDDGRHDISRVANICKEYNVPLCVAIPVNSLDDATDDGRTVLDVCKSVVSNGGEVLSHGMDYTVLSDATDYNLIATMLKDSKEHLTAQGFDVRGFIRAGGANAIEWKGNNLQRFTQLYYDYSDLCGDDLPYYKNRVGLGYTNIATAKGYVDDAIANKKWYTFMSHTLDGTESQLTEAWFKEFLEYATSRGIKFKTYAYMYDNFGVWK